MSNLDYWDETQPPSRGQVEQIARQALKLLGEDFPENRMDASVIITRLRQAQLAEGAPAPVLREAEAF